MAGIIAKRVIEEIRIRNNVVDVVGSYIPLHRAGSAFKALCPFHKEKTPSFLVNPERQIFHCFGCGSGGDVFRFVMQHENVDFVAAARILAGKAGIRLEYEDGRRDEEDDKSALYQLLEEAAQFYQRILTKSEAGAPAREYLKQREIPDEVLKEFLVGYVPERWDSILTWAQKNKHPTAQLEAAGMIVKSTKPGSKSDYYDRFRNRIMFPIQDTQGRVIGFSGRIIKKGDEEAAKYVNSPETALFHKSQVLYALSKAKHEITDKREAIICEGQIDVIRCHMGGFKNAVAAQGTAFTEDHARIIKRYSDGVALVFDSDTAGQNATIKAAKTFMKAGLAVRAVRLPKGEDPDSFIRKNGPPAFQALLDGALSAIEFQVRVLESNENIRSEAGIMRAAKAVLQTVAETPNAVQRARLMQEASTLLNLPPAALEEELRRVLRAPTPTYAGKEEAPPAKKVRPKEELELAEHVVTNPELGAIVQKYLPAEMFSDRQCADIIIAAVQAAKEGRPLIAVVSEHDDAEGGLSRFTAELQMAPQKALGGEFSPEGAVKDLILSIMRREYRKKRLEIEHRIQTGQAANGEDLRLQNAQLTSDLKLLQKWETALPLLEMQGPAKEWSAKP